MNAASTPFRVCLLSLMLGWLAHCPMARAEATYEDTIEPYVVQSGDTISHITYRFLGDVLFWRDNWKLNPQVKDPDKLRIGQVLQIITHRKVIAEAAEVVQAVNRTEKMLAPPEWQPAQRGDQLTSGDGLRTRQNSTAELRFNTESILRLEEFSQVFLAEKQTSLRGVDRGSVKVERGAVGLVFQPLKKPRTEIEIIAGPAVTRAQPEANVGTNLRAAPTDDGGAKVMVYQGKSEVAAGGEKVAVRKGMGTRVPESGPPMPPVKLLPAPALETESQQWNYSNGILRWKPVEHAAQYVIEVCADAECRQPLQSKQVEAERLSLQVDPLPAGSSFWRVHALSDQQLDGHNSAAGQIEVTDPRPDLAGPMIAFQPVSGFVIDESGQYRLGSKAQLRVHAHDEQSGLASVEIKDAQGQWQPLQADLSLQSIGSQAQVIRARDQLGNVSELELTWPDAAP